MLQARDDLLALGVVGERVGHGAVQVKQGRVIRPARVATKAIGAGLKADHDRTSKEETARIT